jgi:hypothetical protein
MKAWVDPPSGWRWGFPKIYDRLEHGDSVLAWLVAEGYPQVEIDRLGDHFFTRQWPADEPEAPYVGFRRGIPVNPRNS